MYCRNYTVMVSCILCREVYYTVSLFGEVSPYLVFFDLHLSGPCTKVQCCIRRHSILQAGIFLEKIARGAY